MPSGIAAEIEFAFSRWVRCLSSRQEIFRSLLSCAVYQNRVRALGHEVFRQA
jgi:hypothetical protein